MFRTPWSFRVLLARYGKSSINYLDRSGVGQQAGKSIELCQDMFFHSVTVALDSGQTGESQDKPATACEVGLSVNCSARRTGSMLSLYPPQALLLFQNPASPLLWA
jgi:hypothetical protein